MRCAFRSVRICFKTSAASVVMMHLPNTDSTDSLNRFTGSDLDGMTGFAGVTGGSSAGGLAARCVRMELSIDSRAELLIQIVKALRLDRTQVAAIRPRA